MGRGNVSPMTTQAAGPQVEAKKKMDRQMNAIMAEVAETLEAGAALPIIATMNWQINMPRPP